MSKILKFLGLTMSLSVTIGFLYYWYSTLLEYGYVKMTLHEYSQPIIIIESVWMTLALVTNIYFWYSSVKSLYTTN